MNDADRFRALGAAQTFIQMSDPQFGMYTKNESFGHEQPLRLHSNTRFQRGDEHE